MTLSRPHAVRSQRSRAAVLLAVALAAAACTTSAPDTMKRVKETGRLAVGYRETSVPFSFVGDDKQPSGYSVELCRRIAASVQKELGLPALQIRWVPVTPEDRITAVASGAVDIECGSTTNTLSRQERVDFTSMTFVDGGSLLVTTASGIRRVADLGGKRVAVIPGTTTEQAVAAALKKSGVTAQVVSVKEHAEGLALLDGGGADAYASDRVLLIGLASSRRTSAGCGSPTSTCPTSPTASWCGGTTRTFASPPTACSPACTARARSSRSTSGGSARSGCRAACSRPCIC